MSNLYECGGCHGLNSPGLENCGHCGLRLTEDMEIDDGLQREIERQDRLELSAKERYYIEKYGTGDF